MTLVILAAGIGSRFGGLKQIEPINKNGEFLIDYSVYDAIKAGFNKVVFIVKPEIYDTFRNTIGKRIENQIKVEYAVQEISALPQNFKSPETRTKPWGTVHALLACKNIVNENFAIINADDFYGYDALKTMAEFLRKQEELPNIELGAMVGYQVENTLTENGAAKRAVCEIENGFLTKLVESSVEKVGDKIIAKPLNGAKEFEVQEGTTVSMNMFMFTPKVLDYFEEQFVAFLKEHKEKDDFEKCEYIISDAVYEQILEKKLAIKVLKTSAKWQGMTYKEDKEKVVKAMQALVENKEYPEKLWK